YAGSFNCRWLVNLIVAGHVVLGVISILLGNRPTAPPRIAVLWPYDVGTPADETFGNLVITGVWEKLAHQKELHLLVLSATRGYIGTNTSPQTVREELGAEYSLVPSVIWSAPEAQPHSVFIQFELGDENGITVWTDTYPVESTVSMETIDTISREVAVGVVSTLSPRSELTDVEMTDNPDAQRFFLQGFSYLRRQVDLDSRLRTTEMFNKCVQEDPDFGRGWAYLSYTTTIVAYRHDKQELWDQAKEALEKAQQLSPESSDTMLAQAFYDYYFLRDFKRAAREFREILRLEPGNTRAHSGLGYVSRKLGDYQSCIGHLIQVYELAPNQSALLSTIGYTALISRQYQQAETYYERHISLKPETPATYVKSALLYLLWKGDIEKSRRVFELMPTIAKQQFNLTTLQPDDRALLRVHAEYFNDWIREFDDLSSLQEADLAATVGDSSTALDFYEKARLQYTSIIEDDAFQSRTSDWRAVYFYQLGLAHAGLGNVQSAIEYGKRAVEVNPIEDDAVEGPYAEIALAEIYTQTGHSDEAITILERMLDIPALISANLLRIDPRWDPLREHPRFQALLNKHN
ncbi:tetratricopeptide repeat protein, partial [Gemmatimonadota bacterium]